jgi:phosphoglycerate dehydrogenase-like enzyme
LANDTTHIIVVQGATEVSEVGGLAEQCADCEIRFAPDGESLARALPGADILLGWNFAARELRDCWHLADDVRWVHWCGAGVDAALFPGMVEGNAVLTNARGIFDDAMAEYTLGLVLTFAKGFKQTFEAQTERRWAYAATETIAGKRALVVGAGSIGSAVGKQLRAAGMQVSGVARSARPASEVFDAVHSIDQLDNVLPDADYVVLVTPLTPSTEGLFNADKFKRMAPHARFVNLGRGQLVVEDDLMAALNEGTIDGAALDVFYTEPLGADSPLWTTPNLIVSPHMSGDFVGFKDVMAEQFYANFARYKTGEPLVNVVDKVAGYVPRDP